MDKKTEAIIRLDMEFIKKNKPRRCPIDNRFIVYNSKDTWWYCASCSHTYVLCSDNTLELSV